jgi:predicted transcriptional regulator
MASVRGLLNIQSLNELTYEKDYYQDHKTVPVPRTLGSRVAESACCELN